MITLVLSCCGRKDWFNEQRSIDSRWPIARCPDHKGHHPLISEGTFTKRSRQRALDASNLTAFDETIVSKPVNFTDLTKGR